MKNLTREQLDSITFDHIKALRKLKSILSNMDIHADDPQYMPLLKEGMAAREFGLTYKRIEAIFDERKVL